MKRVSERDKKRRAFISAMLEFGLTVVEASGLWQAQGPEYYGFMAGVRYGRKTR